MRAIGYKSKKNKAELGAYLRARRSTLIFCGLFVFGLCAASIAAVGGGDTAETLRGVIINSFEICAKNTLWQLWQKSLIRNLCLLIFLYFCANCSKGALPASLAPIGIGLAAGARVTVLLGEYGYAALKFCALGVALPKTVEALIVAGIYNSILKACRGSSATALPAGVGSSGIRFALYALALAAQALLEGWLASIL